MIDKIIIALIILTFMLVGAASFWTSMSDANEDPIVMLKEWCDSGSEEDNV